MFQKATGAWIELRSKLNLLPDDEVDLHFGRRDSSSSSYDSVMSDVARLVRTSLEKAQLEKKRYLLFGHGSSTSRLGKTTARSVVRGFMRSEEATPFIEREHCIQHESVFVAKIRPPNDAAVKHGR